MSLGYTCGVCNSRREVIDLIDNVFVLIDMRENMVKGDETNKKISRIILEESIFMYWDELKGSIKKMKVVDQCLRNTMFWKIERLQELAVFIGKHLNGRMGPCDFTTFLEDLFDRPNIRKDLLFLRWILSSPARCNQVFMPIEMTNKS